MEPAGCVLSPVFSPREPQTYPAHFLLAPEFELCPVRFGHSLSLLPQEQVCGVHLKEGGRLISRLLLRVARWRSGEKCLMELLPSAFSEGSYFRLTFASTCFRDVTPCRAIATCTRNAPVTSPLLVHKPEVPL